MRPGHKLAPHQDLIWLKMPRRDTDVMQV